MEKIRINSSQKSYVDSMIANYGIEAFAVFMDNKDKINNVLKGFTLEETSLIFNNWFELDTFKVNDFVKIYGKRYYYRIVHLENNKISLRLLDNQFKEDITEYEMDKIRLKKVNDKWKLILLNLGRSVPVLRKNDVILTKEGEVLTYIHPLESKEMLRRFKSGEYSLFYPVENSIC